LTEFSGLFLEKGQGMRRTALVLCLGLSLALADDYEVDCNTLRMGQYICPDPAINHIDPQTQQPRNCTRENKALGTFHHL